MKKIKKTLNNTNKMKETIAGKKIIIIGGGMAGLASAIAITKSCTEKKIFPLPQITIIERDENGHLYSSKQNHSLSLKAQAIDSMKYLEIYENVKGNETEVNKMFFMTHDRSSYSVLCHTTTDDRVLRIGRFSLLRFLCNQAEKNQNTKIKWGGVLENIETNENGEVEITYQQNGLKEIEKANFVIAADGNKSKTRGLLLPNEKLEFQKVAAIIFLIDIPIDHEIPKLIENGSGMIFGVNSTMFVAHESLRQFMVGLSLLVDNTTDNKEDEEIVIKNIFENAKQFPPLIRDLMKYEEKGSRRFLYCYDKLPNKSTLENKVIFVGDSSHPHTPYSGYGACQALNDAVSLADKLTSPKFQTIRQAIQSFDDEMVKRASKSINRGRFVIKYGHTSNPYLILIRNFLLRLINFIFHHPYFVFVIFSLIIINYLFF